MPSLPLDAISHRGTGMRKPQLMTPAARAQLMVTACDALQQALCKVYDLWCDQHGLPHLSADEQDCQGMQAGQVEWLTRFQDAWSFYERADGEARADLRETAAQLPWT